MYTQNNLAVKRRNDLEDVDISSIWLELGLPRQKKILVANVYREWQHMGQFDKESASVPAQLARWKKFLDRWELALKEDMEIEQSGFQLNSR